MSADRLPLSKEETILFTAPTFTQEACRSLLDFFAAYQEKNWNLFLSLRAEWKKAHPEMPMTDALCANIQPMTGAFRPLAEQKIWCWGDGRGLGTWCYALLSDRVPDKTITLRTGESANLRKAIAAYCDAIYLGTRRRYDLGKGTLPIAADPRTGMADDHPWNPKTVGTKTFANLFSVTGWVLYGFLSGEREIVDFGLKELDAVIASIENNTYSLGLSTQDPKVRSHGPRMITLGVIAEILKGIGGLEKKGNTQWSGLTDGLVKRALPLIGWILDGNYRSEPPALFEKADLSGNPLKINGVTNVDPGHASELSGFLAQLIPFLPQTWDHKKWNRKSVLDAALKLHLFADRVGFSPKGVMYKAVDLWTEKPLPDTQALTAAGRLTAPWWNVREHSAAALKLYTLTRDPRLIETYRKGQHASYLAYPNKRIMDQMIQTVDPETLDPLDIAPATGNMDPMHDPRARAWEMECLEEFI